MRLTERQRDVLRLMAESKTNGEIADALGISLDGAKWHVSEILAKLDVPSREEAVAVWRDETRIQTRLRRWIATPAALLAGGSQAMKVAVGAATVGTIAVAAVALTLALSESSQPAARDDPDSAGELLERIASELAANGRILHLEAEARAISSSGGDAPRGVAQSMGSYEAWFDFENELARINFTRDPDIDLDIAERWTAWFEANHIYQLGPDDAAPRKGQIGEWWSTCMDIGPFLVEILACGIDNRGLSFDGADIHLMPETTWNNRRAIGLAYEWSQETPDQPAQNLQHTARFYVDPGSYLPLGWEMTAEREPSGETWSMTIDYQATTMERDSTDSQLFDPRAAGYRTANEEELDLLDNPHGGGPVWWLERQADIGGSVGRVELERVEHRYAPARPTTIMMHYRSESGGRLTIEVWETEGWRDFVAMLDETHASVGGNYPFAPDCVQTDESEAGGHRVTIIAGHDADLSSDGSAGAEECPPRNTFMATVSMNGYVVTLNAPIGLYPNSELYGAFDSPEALTAAATELRLRGAGE